MLFFPHVVFVLKVVYKYCLYRTVSKSLIHFFQKKAIYNLMKTDLTYLVKFNCLHLIKFR